MALYSTLSSVYLFELRMLSRDRRTLFAAVILPILVMPLFFLSSSINESSRQDRIEEQVFTYAVSPEATELVDTLLAAAHRGEAAPERSGDDRRPRIRLEREPSDDGRQDLENQFIHVFIDRAPTDDRGAGSLPLLLLFHRADWDGSTTAAAELDRLLERGRRERRSVALERSGFPIPESRVAILETEDLASEEQLAGATLGRFAAFFVMLFLLTGGSVVAADSIAGEKERGTLETLLTTAASRGEIVRAKQLLVLTVGIAITFIQLANFSIYIGLDVIELPAGLDADLSFGKVLLLLLLFLPMAAIASNTLLLASGLSRTYKEFQVYFLPVFLVLLLPTAASILPGVELRSAIVLVPLANLAVAVREVLVGTLDWSMLLVAFLVSSGTAVAMGKVTARSLSTERLAIASDFDRADFEGGPALFRRHAARWFALMWATLFLASSSATLGSSLQRQLGFNLVVVFLGGSLLMMRRYRLPVAETLRLRPARPVVWLAVIVAAPAWFVTAVAIGRLSFWLFPLPAEMMEEFSRSVVPGQMPLGQLLLLVAVLPGICEEIAFRGVLLKSLEGKRVWIRAVVVGAVFGFFHFHLVRFLPTAILGALLTLVTLWSGSLFPAMLWHTLNNGTAIVADRLMIPIAELPISVYATSALVTALSLWLLWRSRPDQVGLANSERISR